MLFAVQVLPVLFFLSFKETVVNNLSDRQPNIAWIYGSGRTSNSQAVFDTEVLSALLISTHNPSRCIGPKKYLEIPEDFFRSSPTPLASGLDEFSGSSFELGELHARIFRICIFNIQQKEKQAPQLPPQQQHQQREQEVKLGPMSS